MKTINNVLLDDNETLAEHILNLGLNWVNTCHEIDSNLAYQIGNEFYLLDDSVIILNSDNTFRING